MGRNGAVKGFLAAAVFAFAFATCHKSLMSPARGLTSELSLAYECIRLDQSGSSTKPTFLSSSQQQPMASVRSNPMDPSVDLAATATS
jgi:hypothetical protein